MYSSKENNKKEEWQKSNSLDDMQTNTTRITLQHKSVN